MFRGIISRRANLLPHKTKWNVSLLAENPDRDYWVRHAFAEQKAVEPVKEKEVEVQSRALACWASQLVALKRMSLKIFLKHLCYS